MTNISCLGWPKSCCKFLKSTKFEANLIHAIDFASVEIFSVTYISLDHVINFESLKIK